MANSEIEEKGTQVLGISIDSRPTQTAFATALGGIPYPLLADFHPKGRVAQLYGVYNDDRGAANRAVFVIDKDGVIRFKRVYASMPEFSVSEVLGEVGKL